MKRTVTLLLSALLLALLLCGCCFRHEWTPATCTEPKICAKCGKTSGNPLGHDWQPATCTAPETCSRCAAVQGKALGHSPTVPDYQTPSLCTVCGDVVAPAVTADFVRYGIELNLGTDAPSEYVTACKSDITLLTVGEARVADYRVVPSDSLHPLTDGYEWRLLDIELTFSDENARLNGVQISTGGADFYDIALRDGSTEPGKNPEEETFLVSYRGEEKVCRMLTHSEWSGWKDSNDGRRINVCTVSWAYQVPVGYDGCVACLRGSQNAWPEDQHLYDIYDGNFLMFRLS